MGKYIHFYGLNSKLSVPLYLIYLVLLTLKSKYQLHVHHKEI